VQVRFWGTRGSIAAPGPATVRYGGNTACVELRTAAGELFILDSGTGIRELGLALMAAGGPVRGHILLSHTHWDHIQGFPFFAPAFAAGNEFWVYAGRDLDRDLESVLAGQMEHVYFPVRLADLAATVRFRDLDEGEYRLGSARVRVQYLHHTSPTMGYRIHADDRVLVYATDNEPHDRTLRPLDTLGRSTAPWPGHEGDRRFVEFIRGADLLIADAQYVAEEFPARIGWGHSTVEHAVDFAVAGAARRLVLFHHDPTRSDDAVDALLERARARVAAHGARLEVLAAAEGLVLTV
jgi:phosphoribosyl 1,2-cyclic phosphodiesterase